MTGRFWLTVQVTDEFSKYIKKIQGLLSSTLGEVDFDDFF
jgi:hypothetical protein